jgi:hypothetical protein
MEAEIIGDFLLRTSFQKYRLAQPTMAVDFALRKSAIMAAAESLGMPDKTPACGTR